MKIFQIGKMPPPIGGVTIHVKRLIEYMMCNKYDIEFININVIKIIKIIVLRNNDKYIVHLHTSSPFLRFIFCVFKFLNKKSILIITFHGNIGRFSGLKNWMDLISVKLADTPILLNEESYNTAKLINAESKLISAFIPPVSYEILNKNIENSVKMLKTKSTIIFSTYAYKLTYDKYNNEIYCGTQLLKLFCESKNQEYGLIFSDPSGDYLKHIEKIKLKLTNNILLISEPHTFYEVLRITDCFIRCTTTDGDPLSLKEALFLKKVVFASNIIKRPTGVYTFSWYDNNQLQNLINNSKDYIKNKFNYDIYNGAIKLMELYGNKEKL